MHSLKNRKRDGHGGEELMSAKNTKAAFRSPQATTHVKKVKGYEEMARHTARSTKLKSVRSTRNTPANLKQVATRLLTQRIKKKNA
mmetsp:Transcript_29035/g.39497  ORF Transcript_29035/g.39497 Transcript_29035/m.39497 type:complete len:86 (-) Transcript_29035:284-541(-)